jgi:hypothetical protein
VCDICASKPRTFSHFLFSEGPESGVSFAPSFPFFPSDQFSLLKAEKREERERVSRKSYASAAKENYQNEIPG